MIPPKKRGMAWRFNDRKVKNVTVQKMEKMENGKTHSLEVMHFGGPTQLWRDRGGQFQNLV